MMSEYLAFLLGMQNNFLLFICLSVGSFFLFFLLFFACLFEYWASTSMLTWYAASARICLERFQPLFSSFIQPQTCAITFVWSPPFSRFFNCSARCQKKLIDEWDFPMGCSVTVNAETERCRSYCLIGLPGTWDEFLPLQVLWWRASINKRMDVCYGQHLVFAIFFLLIQYSLSSKVIGN